MRTDEAPLTKMLGSILLISGSCIGAGMLGLPVLTALGGFRPTLALFVLSWLFMATTGLLLLEVSLCFGKEVNIVTMAGSTLGRFGEVAAWFLYTFLFYSLMVAYVAGSGQLFTDFLKETLGVAFPEWGGCLFLTALLGIFLYMGTLSVDRFNRVLMAGLIAAYLTLLLLGIRHVNPAYLQHVNWQASLFAIPTMIISFGFHNLIPSLTTYLEHDARRLRTAILVGSVIPLVVYLLWEWLILGLVPIDGAGGFREALGKGDVATRALRQAVGASWIVDVAEYFAFFAIVTSFLTVGLSFVDFLADGLGIKKDVKGKEVLCLLCLGPPFAFALLYPKVFLLALNYAGAFGAVILFGIMPAAMVWSGRYVKKLGNQPLVPGGKAALCLVTLISAGVVALEIYHRLYAEGV